MFGDSQDDLTHELSRLMKGSLKYNTESESTVLESIEDMV